jgi:hypothetical protein
MPGGEVEQGSEPTLSLEAVAGGQIDYIDVIRNGALVRRVVPETEAAAIGTAEGKLETILVLEMGWGARGKEHRWAGSLAVEGGDILSVEPRLRGAEVVSPLEGDADGQDNDRLTLDGNRIVFSITAAANPNNMTPATQAIAARVRLDGDARIVLETNGQRFEATAARLLEGAFARNLGPIDSPAFRLQPLPRPHQWQWQGRLALEPLRRGDWVYARMRQANGQWAWASPVFCR